MNPSARCASLSIFIRLAHDTPAKILEQSIADISNDLEARCRLSAVQIMQEDCDSAMEQLLEIVHRDAGDDQAGRPGPRYLRLGRGRRWPSAEISALLRLAPY